MMQANEQLQSIHAMLAAGNRCVHLERHSLVLIGVVGGLVAALTEEVITVERFPDAKQRAVMLLLWLGAWLGTMAFTDYILTRRARQRRDETLPFAQAQITRAWWMLLTMGTLSSFAMSFYGGGAMIYGLWIVLLGLGIYLFGLFSRRLVEWFGIATILLGVTGLAAGLPYGVTRWLASSCFAIGMPLAGWLNSRYGDANAPARVLALLAWIVLVVGPPLALHGISSVEGPESPVLSLGGGQLGLGGKVLHLDPGALIALRVDLDSPVLTVSPDASLMMNLVLPIDVSLRDGVPDGRYRIGNNEWHSIHDRLLNLRIDRFAPRLEDGKPVVRAHAVFTLHGLSGASQ